MRAVLAIGLAVAFLALVPAEASASVGLNS